MKNCNKVKHGSFLTNDLPDKSQQLIIADPPYYKVKGDFDFIWKTFDDYLKDVKKWAIECKRLLADNGTLLWYGSAKKIAYTQIILDKYFNLENSIVWENTNQAKQSMKNVSGYRSFPPLTERILFYSNDWDISSGEMVSEKAAIKFASYLRIEFKRAKVTNREIAALFPSRTGGLTGCVSNWLNGNNIVTKEQYLKIRNHLNGDYLKQEYEDLKQEYEDLKQEYEDLRRPFDNIEKHGDVIRISNYDGRKYKHDTPKPEKLTETLILTTSRKGDNIFVPFAGSGTECSMTAKTGRNFEGWDIEKKYVDMSNERVKEHLEQLRLF